MMKSAIAGVLAVLLISLAVDGATLGPCIGGACPSGYSCISNMCTTAAACVDLKNPSTGVSDCPSRAYLCTNSVYYTLMTQQCPKTCGRCTSG